MTNIYIKVNSDGKIYKSVASNLSLLPSDEVLIDSEQGQEAAVVTDSNGSSANQENGEETEITIIRKLTDKDREVLVERKEEAKKLLPICEDKIKKHDLVMDLLDADISYDGKKLTFYFSAPGRVDFRALVPDLASSFKKLIRLQQIGSRDKAKCMSGFGRCGRKICCQFLKGDLDSVNLEMANDQNLGQMGSNRVTGLCGKLMCCLKYEQSLYKETKKNMPKIGSRIKTPEGEGIVISCSVIKNKVSVELSDKRIVEVSC